MLHRRDFTVRYRHSDVVFAAFAIGILITVLSFFGGSEGVPISQAPISQAPISPDRGLVARLEFSDLALFTEARYLRHPAQADLHSAFQDHPASFDHFPGGSLISPRLNGLRERSQP